MPFSRLYVRPCRHPPRPPRAIAPFPVPCLGPWPHGSPQSRWVCYATSLARSPGECMHVRGEAQGCDYNVVLKHTLLNFLHIIQRTEDYHMESTGFSSFLLPTQNQRILWIHCTDTRLKENLSVEKKYFLQPQFPQRESKRHSDAGFL